MIFACAIPERHLEQRKRHKLTFSQPKPDHREGKPPKRFGSRGKQIQKYNRRNKKFML